MPLNHSTDAVVNRCPFHSTAGRRCRLTAHPDGHGLCLPHFRRSQASSSQPFREEDLSYLLSTPGGLFVSQITIHHYLAKLLLALAANRVSPRRASSLAYICNLLTRAQKGAKEEIAHWSDEEELCCSLAEMQGFRFPANLKSAPDSNADSKPKPDADGAATLTPPEPVSIS